MDSESIKSITPLGMLLKRHSIRVGFHRLRALDAQKIGHLCQETMGQQGLPERTEERKKELQPYRCIIIEYKQQYCDFNFVQASLCEHQSKITTCTKTAANSHVWSIGMCSDMCERQGTKGK